jgi:hypothetical protein
LNSTGALKSNDKEVQTYSGTLRIASVGQVTEENQPCRWIEVQLDMTLRSGDLKGIKADVFKVLIPEIFLTKGEAPLEHTLRAWIKSGDGETRKLPKPSDFDKGPLPIVLSRPWKNVKQLDKIEVESKLGKLQCEGVQGLLELPMRKQNGMMLMRCKLESRLHPDSPFGVVSSRWTIRTPEASPTQATMEWDLKLVDIGDDARSKILEGKEAQGKGNAPDAKAEGDKAKTPDPKTDADKAKTPDAKAEDDKVKTPETKGDADKAKTPDAK